VKTELELVKQENQALAAAAQKKRLSDEKKRESLDRSRNKDVLSQPRTKLSKLDTSNACLDV